MSDHGVTTCCETYTPYGAYGPAVDSSYIDSDGKLWIGNGEYESQVNYCPFCGKKARTPVIKEPT